MDNGHEIEVVPSSRLTTFGVGMCIKENDGSYTNVPLGVFLESGYADKDGRMAPAMLPHSGLDMRISGPLAGTRKDGTPSELALQHFIGMRDMPVGIHMPILSCRLMKLCQPAFHSVERMPFEQRVYSSRIVRQCIEWTSDRIALAIWWIWSGCSMQ